MDYNILHAKVIETGKKNYKTLTLLYQHIRRKKKEEQSIQHRKYDQFQKQYDELVSLSHESQAQNIRLSQILSSKQLHISKLSNQIAYLNAHLQQLRQQRQQINEKKQQKDQKQEKEEIAKVERDNLKDEVQRMREQINKMQTQLSKKRRQKQQLLMEGRNINTARLQQQTELQQIDRLNRVKQTEVQRQIIQIKQQYNQEKFKHERESQDKAKKMKKQILGDIKAMIRVHRESYML